MPVIPSENIACKVLSSDVKIDATHDNTLEKIKVCDWLSVYDNQVGNIRFRQLNKLLRTLFPKPCQYEKVIEKAVKQENVQVIQKRKPKKPIYSF